MRQAEYGLQKNFKNSIDKIQKDIWRPIEIMVKNSLQLTSLDPKTEKEKF